MKSLLHLTLIGMVVSGVVFEFNFFGWYCVISVIGTYVFTLIPYNDMETQK